MGVGDSPFVLLLLLAASTLAHPGGIAGGRASCGAEFDAPGRAFVIPTVDEAWKQEVYVAVITPEIARFRDQHRFHAVLLGPGLPAMPLWRRALAVRAPGDAAGGVISVTDIRKQTLQFRNGSSGSPQTMLSTAASPLPSILLLITTLLTTCVLMASN
eukprot:gene45204-26455_t